jgi:hypothetical protein
MLVYLTQPPSQRSTNINSRLLPTEATHWQRPLAGLGFVVEFVAFIKVLSHGYAHSSSQLNEGEV